MRIPSIIISVCRLANVWEYNNIIMSHVLCVNDYNFLQVF